MPTHRIAVTVGQDAIHVEPDTLVMTSDDLVHWDGGSGRGFSIVFDTHTAFGQKELPHAMARTHQKPKARGRFKYTVVSNDDPKLQLDPIIIVEEPPSKPHPGP